MRKRNFSFSACLPGASRPRHCVSANFALPSGILANLPSVKSRLVPTILPFSKPVAGSWNPLVPMARKPLISHILAAIRVLDVAILERVFFGLPVIALELVGGVRLAGSAPAALERLGDAGHDEAVGQSARRADPCSVR